MANDNGLTLGLGAINIVVSLMLLSGVWLITTSKQQLLRPLWQHKLPPTLSQVFSAYPSQAPASHRRDTIKSFVDAEKLLSYKNLYYKLQNLEHYPEIISEAREVLLAMFQEALERASKDGHRNILSINVHTREDLLEFVEAENNGTTERWEKYVTRRASGTPRELVVDKDDAVRWLRAIAPLKFVDGAWLGHVNRITTPFPLRFVTKDAWQILSEELGDGEIKKNHVYVFKKLLKDVGVELPEGDSEEFVDSNLGLNESSIWKAAVAQLLVSLFPHDCLPEILGFNMHFELLTLETLIASKELAELKINPYYFALHVTIDNADSGHTAIAMQAVNKYVDYTRKTEGTEAANRAWKRVQTGYLLSEQLAAVPDVVRRKVHGPKFHPQISYDLEVLSIFRSKASAAHKIHCSSRLRIGGRTLVDWLDPEFLVSEKRQHEFLEAFSSCKPWIIKGNSSGSKMVQDLAWSGKMFGAFTNNETEVLKKWIDSLGQKERISYWSFTNQDKERFWQSTHSGDIRHNYPVFASVSNIAYLIPNVAASSPPLPRLHDKIDVTAEPDMTRLLPLWFTAPCLLEGCISIPAKTTTQPACAVVRILRAQSGFKIERSGVESMDEARRQDSVGLVELGLEMSANSMSCSPGSIKQVLELWPSNFSLGMLHLSMRPTSNINLLLGMAWGFVELHDAMKKSKLLSGDSKEVLQCIILREHMALQHCLDELRMTSNVDKEFGKGLGLARAEIARCFGA